MGTNKRQCKCCGNYAVSEYCSFELCFICGWKVDAKQEENPDCENGTNGYSLNEYREIYLNTTKNKDTLKLTPYDDRMCPIYQRVIDGELCYETALCMQGLFHISSVPEADYIRLSFEDAKKICTQCPYGDMS